MTEKKIDRKYSAFISCVLAFITLITSVPVIIAAQSPEKKLLISDCESGWTYYGNSQISYQQDGTEGKCLSVTGAYGVMRRISFVTEGCELSDYNRIEWDFRAVSAADGSDILTDVIDSYKQSISFTLYYNDGSYVNYIYNDMHITAAANGWYHFSVILSAGAGSLLTNVEICILDNNSFNTSLPETNFYIDSLYAVGSGVIDGPEIEGAQVDRDDCKMRILASVNKSEYENLKRNVSDCEFGFIVINSDIYNGVINSGEYGADYVSGEPALIRSEQMYKYGDDAGRLYFTAVLSDFSSEEKRSMNISVRAWLSYIDEYGVKQTVYSNDGISGGYELSWNKINAEAKLHEISDSVSNDINNIEDTGTKPEISDSSNNERIPGKPYAVPLKYDDNSGICVALYNVAEDFGAPVNTDSDCSAAIQKALNSAKEKGGGTVYIPEGVYKCEIPIEIPQGVTLRGEWQSPEEATPASTGTVLVVDTGAIADNPEAFINLNVGSGVRNLTIIYPDYANGIFEEYSPTISQKLSGTNDSFNVMNVTVLGGSVGYDGSTGWSELHYLKNVYFSSFDTAVRLNNVTDTGRLENINISPEYLIENGLYKVSDEKAAEIRKYAYENSVGLYIQRSDWEYVYELNINGLKNGIFFDKYIDTSDNNRVRGSNGQFFGVTITDCDTAVNCAYTNAIGYAFTGLNISASDGEYGIKFGSEFMAHFEITEMKISGNIRCPVFSECDRKGKVTFTNSVFDTKNLSGFDVNVSGGSLSLQQCSFLKNGKNIIFSENISSASVLGCEFKYTAEINYPAGMRDKINIDSSELFLPRVNYRHIYKKYYPVPTSMRVYDITEYGAESGTDSTEALKKALSDASKTGGIVYVPQGEYYINDYITVPSGVELRGIYDMPTHPVTKGSVLMTQVGKYDENGRAFVTLSEGSGVNGISFYYTDQSYTDFIPYSWTVQSTGKNCWAINTVFINSYNAADFGTYPSDNHYISYISGSPLRRGLFAGNNSANGWVENVQFNPHYWKRSSVSVKETADMEKLNDKINYTLESLIFGYNESEHVLGTFAYGGASILNFEKQDSKGTNGVFIGHGSDGCRTALTVNGIDTVVMINSELVSMNYTDDMHHIVMNENGEGTLALFNTSAWGQPLNSAIVVNGGNLLISQLFYFNLENTESIAVVNGGSLCMTSAMLPVKNSHFIVNGNGTLLSKANIVKVTGEAPENDDNKTIAYIDAGGCIGKMFDWWF